MGADSCCDEQRNPPTAPGSSHALLGRLRCKILVNESTTSSSHSRQREEVDLQFRDLWGVKIHCLASEHVAKRIRPDCQQRNS
jgi:hypothetical protein